MIVLLDFERKITVFWGLSAKNERKAWNYGRKRLSLQHKRTKSALLLTDYLGFLRQAISVFLSLIQAQARLTSLQEPQLGVCTFSFAIALFN